MARHLWSRSHLSPTRLKEFQADPDVPRAQKNANVAEQEALRITLRDLEVGVDRAERGLEERAAATQHAAAGAAAAAVALRVAATSTASASGANDPHTCRRNLSKAIAKAKQVGFEGQLTGLPLPPKSAADEAVSAAKFGGDAGGDASPSASPKSADGGDAKKKAKPPPAKKKGGAKGGGGGASKAKGAKPPPGALFADAWCTRDLCDALKARRAVDDWFTAKEDASVFAERLKEQAVRVLKLGEVRSGERRPTSSRTEVCGEARFAHL